MSHKHTVSHLVRSWIPLAVAIVIAGGLVYGAVQQSYRTGANDPQVQIAEDVVAALKQGALTADAVVPQEPTADIKASLSPFVAIYSATGTPIGSSVALDGKLPTLPDGVLEKADNKDDHRFTWQPTDSFRAAVVIKKYEGANSVYVLAGRSLREVDTRIKDLMLMVGIGTLAALILSFAAKYVLAKKEDEKHEEHAHPHPHEHTHSETV